MQVTIEKTAINDINNDITILCNNISQLSSTPLLDEERNYIREKIIDKKNKLFIFNRFSHFIFVQYYKLDTNDVEFMHQQLRNEAKKLQSKLEYNQTTTLSVFGTDIPKDDFRAYAEGLILSNYYFDKYKTKKNTLLNTISFSCNTLSEKELVEMMHVCTHIFQCRNWVNEPVAELNAETFANQLEEQSKRLHVKCTILGQKQIEALKMGGLLTVNKGSVDEARFVVLEWNPKNAVNKKPIVLVGKGIMYDTGGLNLKPGDYMNDMKSDMAGAATMASTLFAVAENQLPVYTITLIPATDNRPCGNAYTSGDIITMHDGTTVEVCNTDAEGRIILADAISYANDFEPELIIDAATLTGAAQRAIGKFGIVAMHQNAKEAMDALKNTGESVYERIAEFPFWKEYDEWIKSDIADIKNCSNAPQAGMITAGKFLAHFAKYPFIHLDIAGVAFADKKESFYGIGGTGFGVRLLYHFLKKRSNS